MGVSELPRWTDALYEPAVARPAGTPRRPWASRSRGTGQAAALVVLGLLAACGNWGPGSGYIDCAAGLPFEPVPPSDLGPLPGGAAVPSGWQRLTLEDLSFETPAPAAEPIYEDRENSANRRCISWNGDLFSTAVGREAGELLLVTVTPQWQLEEAVGGASEQFFSITVPGADAAVARVSQQQYYDGGGEKVEGQLTTVVQVAVQAGTSVYTMDGSFAPGPPGESVAAGLLSSLAIN